MEHWIDGKMGFLANPICFDASRQNDKIYNGSGVIIFKKPGVVNSQLDFN